MTDVRVLAFLDDPTPLDYGRRFARLRWKKAVGAPEWVSLPPGDPACERIRGEDLWVIVADSAALPLGGPSEIPASGRILAALSLRTEDLPPVHTLRELEEAAAGSAGRGAGTGAPCALCLRPREHPPLANEPVAAYVARLLAAHDSHDPDSQFAGVVVEDPSARERPELSRRVPVTARRLLDVGCGAAGTSGALKKRLPHLFVTGIEKHAPAAARARQHLDQVLEEDAADALASLGELGESFDAFLFGDVLEHLIDPAGALSRARRIARPDAALVASVPNVGQLSLVRDLVLGRFDPTPAGLADAGHLRWFDRRLLAETLEESGWRVLSVESEPGAPSPFAEDFLADLASWPGLARESLRTYQWIAVARAESSLRSKV